jgi:hypothetical protein
LISFIGGERNLCGGWEQNPVVAMAKEAGKECLPAVKKIPPLLSTAATLGGK